MNNNKYLDRIPEQLTNLKELLLRSIYPVGSVYITFDKDQLPGNLFGGTWELINDGYCLISSSSSSDSVIEKRCTDAYIGYGNEDGKRLRLLTVFMWKRIA